MTKSKTPTDDGALRSAMTALSQRTINQLRAAFTKMTGRPANRMKRDELVKHLVTHAEATQPAPSHPTKAEQAEAKRASTRKTGARDPRLPAPGTVIEREYKSKTHRVTVKEDGFTYDGKDWRSLTAIAKEVTGYQAISGTLFFGIAKRPETPAKPAPADDAPAKAAGAPKAKAAKAPRAKRARKG